MTNHMIPAEAVEACVSTVVEPGTLHCAKCGYPMRWNLGNWTHEWPVAK